jgi:acetyl esterase/lipase
MDAAILTLMLWNGQAPHAVGATEWDKPKVHVYKAAKPNGAGVVVCPGGGYGTLAMDHEGKQVAEFFNRHGVTAFVLQYRVAKPGRPGPLHPAPLVDAQRALRLMRSQAAELKLEDGKIGIVGFSAGGHLASSAATHFDTGDAKAADPVDRVSCRPDFLVLGYPVISMENGVTHGGSRKNLFGNEPTPEQIEKFSNDKQVTDKTPPTFIFHTNEDTSVVPENAIRFYLACKKANVPAELHLYEKGKHGVGMNPKTSSPTDQWGLRLAEWLKARNIIK